MQRVCLVTYFGDNYGGCLQAYATQEVIKSENCSVELLNYQYNKKKSKFHVINKWLQRFRNIKYYIFTRDVLVEHRSKLHLSREAFQKFRQSNMNIMSDVVCSIEEVKQFTSEFDTFIAGSDQIWNPTFYSRCNPIYYLDFVSDGKKRISYASSIGISEMPEKYTRDFRRMISNIDYVSVRETAGAQIIKKVCDRDVPVVLDPTLLLSAERWDKVCSDRVVDGDYIFCYLFSQNAQYSEIKEKMKSILGCKIVTLPFGMREIVGDDEKIYGAGPGEFISLIKHAKFIITDSFHATVFSINYKKAFFVLERQKKGSKSNMNSRIYSVLNLFNLQNRLVNPMIGRQEIMEIDEIDYEQVHSILRMHQQESLAYLKEALHGEDL